jgi:catechol 2,3-dioxygenase-like lactoylglutathione lyase family enzyme
MLLRDDVRIELLHWHDSAPGDVPERRPMDRPGLTHLCFRVDEPTELFEIARRSGGAAWPETLSVVEAAASRVQAVYLTDPDGVRIECLAGSPDLSKS